MNERELSAAVVADVFDKGFGNIVLKDALSRHKEMSRVQKAFVTEVVNGTFRNLIRIDYVIGRFSTVKVKKMRPYVLNVLRISVYQLMFMDRVPDSAVCNEAVKLIKKKGFTNLGGFVNGVLRNIARSLDKIPYPDEKKDPVSYLSVMYSYPTEIIEYWLETFSYDEVLKMCAENLKTPKVSAAVNTLKTDEKGLIKAFKEDNIGSVRAKIGEGILNVSKTSDISESAAFKQGLFHIMDQSAYLCIKLLDPKKGERILDVCAAPGGKSFLAAYLMENTGEIVSRDIYKHKLRLVQNVAKRLGIDIIKPELFDAAQYKPEDKVAFDRVLVDAPCSGLGLLKKKPDIKYNKTLEDIEALVELQKKILTAAQEYVKPGGVLAYSTCTVSKKENEDIRDWFLKEFDFDCCDISSLVPKGGEAPTLKEGYINITPYMWGGDGFFAAKFIKR